MNGEEERSRKRKGNEGKRKGTRLIRGEAEWHEKGGKRKASGGQGSGEGKRNCGNLPSLCGWRKVESMLLN